MLDKRTIDIPFTRGIENKSNPRLAPPGGLSLLRDGIFADKQTISRRAGYVALAPMSVAQTPIGAGKRLASLGKELLVESSSGLNAVAAVGEGFADITRTRKFTRAGLDIRSLAPSPGKTFAQDVAYSADKNVSCWVWSEATHALASAGIVGFRCAVVDESTGAFVLPPTPVGYLGRWTSSPRVLYAPSAGLFHIYFFASDGANNELVVASVPAANPVAVSAALPIEPTSAIFSGPDIQARLDAVYSPEANAIFLAHRNAAGNIRALKLNPADGVSVLANDTVAIGGGLVDLAVAAVLDDFNAPVFVVAWHRGDQFLVAKTYTANFLGGFGPTTLSNTAGDAGNLTRITAAPKPGVSNKLYIYFESGTSAEMNTERFIRRVEVRTSLVVDSGPEVMLRSVGIASRPFAVAGTLLLGVVLFSGTQSTVFVVDATGTYADAPVVARILPEQAGDYGAGGTGLTGVWSRTSRVPAAFAVGDKVTLPVLKRSEDMRRTGSEDTTTTGLARADLDFAAPLASAELGDELFFAGACPLVYDGASVFEAGFNAYPDGDKFAVADGTAGPGLPAGTYQFTLVYEWVDAQGRLWQSVPAVPKSITLAINRRVVITMPTLRLTRRSGVRLAVYRTKDNGTLFYRYQEHNNDLTVDSVAAESSGPADALLGQGEVIYTTGGVLEAEAWPACRMLAVHQNRLVMAGLPDAQAVRYTEQILRSYAPTTHTAYGLAVPPSHGRTTGLASMDDRIIISCERGVWFVYGEGPNRLGQMNGYSPVQLALADEGCHTASPWMVLTPEGLWFRSSRGLRLLTRGLSLGLSEDGVPLGGEVDVLATGLVAAHVTTPSALSQLVYFWTGSGVLVWDVIRRQWSQFTNHAAVDARVWRAGVVHLRGNGALYRSGGTTDAGSAIVMAVATNWLSFAGVQGFQRVWRLVLLGTFPAGTVAQVEYDGAGGGVFSVTGATLTQLRHHLARQKCQTLRLTVLGATAMTSMALEVGVKRGAAKLPAAQTV
jgi:hypothetical protein